MLTAIDSLLLIGLTHWVVWTILSIGKSKPEEKINTYSVGLVGLVVAFGVIIYKMIN